MAGWKFRSWGAARVLFAAGVLFALVLVSGLGRAAAIAHVEEAAPGIHGARIVGTTPGRPFLFLIPATGQGPLTFGAENLPAGLTLDPATGIITGSLEKEGVAVVKLTASGPKGSARRNLVIVGGQHKLALTPPMGWNSWNVWGLSVSDAKVRAAADAMVKSTLAAHGFTYINIDDGWEKCHAPQKSILNMFIKPKPEDMKNCRAADGTVLTNDKFPDMKALADYVHSKGLKLGIYSSPGPLTCGGYTGSYGYEANDAKTYAEWGIDYLKYDWCSYTSVVKTVKVLDALQKPYILMRGELDKVNRDIVFSLCQYGMGDVWKWGVEVGGNLWRTTGDIRDTWNSMSKIGFNQNGHEVYAGPGHWNDPDMLVVGSVGWGPALHKTMLTQDEQVVHITLWAMLAAPLLIGCDMTNLDQFTLDLLTNDEVLDVNQDPLGKAASRKALDGETEVWARPLWDGTQAVAAFNRGGTIQKVTIKWSDLGLSGSQPVRDLWLQKDQGAADGSYTASVPPHGAVMLKVGKPQKGDYAP